MNPLAIFFLGSLMGGTAVAIIAAYVSDEKYAALKKLAADKGYPSVKDLCAAIIEAAIEEAKS